MTPRSGGWLAMAGRRSGRLGRAALAAALLGGCGGVIEIDPYERMSPYERQIYLEPIALQTPPPVPAARLALGYETSCQLAADGRAWCWGRGDHGQLGAAAPERCRGGNVPCSWRALAVQPPMRFAALSPSEIHACGIDDSGRAWCWGFGLGGQLGDGRRSDSAAAVRVAGEHDFVQIDAGRTSLISCALDRDGAAWCWGPAGQGSLGDGSTSGAAAPVRVAGSQRWTAIGVGGEHACALDDGARAWCWGRNLYGALGLGRDESTTRPEPVAGGPPFVALAIGMVMSCALDRDGAAWCWGFGPALGDGSGQSSSLPRAVALGHRFVSLHAGAQHACGLKADGSAWCWGAMGVLLGHGREDQPTVPVPVAGGMRWRTLAAGGVGSCGVGADDARVWCWGLNGAGAVGQDNVDR